MQSIGKLVENKLREKGMSVSEFARRINTNRNNVYDIFNRKSMDTNLLQKISKVLEYDFFQYYIRSETLKQIVAEKSTEYSSNAEIKVLNKKIGEQENYIKLLEDRLSDKEKIIELMNKVQK